MHINGWKVRLKYSEWQGHDILISKNQVLQILHLKHHVYKMYNNQF